MREALGYIRLGMALLTLTDGAPIAPKPKGHPVVVTAFAAAEPQWPAPKGRFILVVEGQKPPQPVIFEQPWATYRGFGGSGSGANGQCGRRW